jgi:hypothetical protein
MGGPSLFADLRSWLHFYQPFAGRQAPGARLGRKTPLYRLVPPDHGPDSREPRGVGARLSPGRAGPDVRESGRAGENGCGTGGGGGARLRATRGAGARHELPRVEPAAGLCVPAGLGGRRPLAETCGAAAAAGVSGGPAIHPREARPHAGEHRDLARRPRRARCQDGQR